MTITVRLKEREERLLRQACRRLNRSQSEIVREAIVRFARLEQEMPTVAERMSKYIGSIDSGRGDLSVDSHRKAREAIVRRHETRRRRTD